MKRFLMMMALIGLVGNWNSTLTAQLVSPDSLYLNEDLPEINIVAVKPLIKAEADKTTYSIAEDHFLFSLQKKREDSRNYHCQNKNNSNDRSYKFSFLWIKHSHNF